MSAGLAQLTMFAQPAEPVASAPAPPAKPTATVAYVEPPPGMARGQYQTPAWIVGLAAVALVMLVVMFFLFRHRRAQRRRVYESVAPSSGPMSSRR